MQKWILACLFFCLSTQALNAAANIRCEQTSQTVDSLDASSFVLAAARLSWLTMTCGSASRAEVLIRISFFMPACLSAFPSLPACSLCCFLSHVRVRVAASVHAGSFQNLACSDSSSEGWGVVLESAPPLPLQLGKFVTPSSFTLRFRAV